jgi:hypothetical protein
MLFRHRRLVLIFPVALTLLAAAGCDSGTDLTTPTVPGTTTTETFPGSLTVNGAVTWQFASSSRGSVSATLTSVGPDSAAVIGFGIGTWNGSSCQILIANDAATQGANVLGTVSGVGNLCLRVYDAGKLTAPATYSVDVTHP